MLSSLTGPPVFRLRAVAAVDSLGDPLEDWSTPVRTRIPRATVHALTSAEDGRLVEDAAELLITGAADLTAADRIEHLARVYRVEGNPVVAVSLASGTVTRATLKRIVLRA